MVCDLENWPKDPLSDFRLKKCLFGEANIAENSDESM